MESFISEVKTLYGIELTQQQEELFRTYAEVLMDWNTRMNLTAIRTPEGIYTKHFLDSLACMKVFPNNEVPNTMIDIGTGAGFPGVVLKILIPHLHLILVESVGKKVAFCTYLVDVLHLRDVEILQERAESLAVNNTYKEQFDVAVARAVAPVSLLSTYLLPFVRKGGKMIAMKGNNVDAELATAGRTIEVLGGRITKHIPYTLPGEAIPRMIIVVEK